MVRLNRLLASVEPVKAAATEAAPKAMEIKQGEPAPKLWVPSANPHSAGTFPLGRKYTVGDETTFRESDPLTGVEQRIFTLRVTKVDPEANRVEFNDGDWVANSMGNFQKMGKYRFDNPVQIFPAELQQGKKWTTRFKGAGQQGPHADLDLRITGVERVRVPAGEFEAFKIEGEGWWSDGREIKAGYWVVPGMNAICVKREFFLRDRFARYLRAERWELIAHRQKA